MMTDKLVDTCSASSMEDAQRIDADFATRPRRLRAESHGMLIGEINV
jgi:hypothetical protein